MKRDRVYYKTMQRLLESDKASGFDQLSAEQSGFLRDEMRRVDGRIMEHQSRLNRLRKADEGAYVEW